MTTRTRAAGILTAITMTALMAACSAGDGSDSASEGTSGEMSDGGGSGAASREFGASEGTASDSTAGSDSGSTPRESSAGTLEMERAVISTGTVSLTSKDVAGTRREVQRIVDAQGGDVADEKTETGEGGTTTYARLVVRVPSSTFSATMSALEETGTLRASNRGSDDVTTEVIDTGARVRAQEASLERVELLLAEAQTLKDIIWIESQLTSRQAELDSLKSQQAWLRDQTSLSTITIDISTPPDEVVEETEDDPAGFVAGLKGGTKALGAMLATVATVLGALLPFAAVALVLGLPIWLVARRRRTPAAVPTDAVDA